ncbi:galactose-1-phosphate uridylyltransferase [candidate division KSB1 bacterium]|nr:galactose-1-phosphate uridylyltransferase [candidate division KSB1 bacterium]NIR72162.1 galactose-1-phosphate uridylyltransferase [candidate division KSB1 bacterium]NIS26627.1 galactose-1-phosphate uridylyltransferase [candidate division KSB1 bacterium]NIT73395.1 galactose-1-phosphate uridylyltransferase [candidate division KSB1 bacterium]NIU27243.1 galactose-1-phosphate uridylyltransferase [candidate division KSB1 bacterium]
MSELRKDPIVGRWVIISTERGKRPSDWATEPKIKGGGFCPFCPGNEDKTPPEIMAIRPTSEQKDVPGWEIRVVPNKFPALQIEGVLYRKGDGNYDMINGVGAHEVVIETSNHVLDLSDLSEEHIHKVLLIFRNRTLDLTNDERFKYILIFKNHGVAAGASLEHTHSQLIATPIIPKRVTEELEGSKRFYNYKERCIYCDIVLQELKARSRLVASNDSYITIEPFAPRFPFETWIIPREHYSHYERMPNEKYLELARMLKDILNRINNLLGYPPYNFIIHTSPIQEPNLLEYHWHIEIIPKLTKIAGFEWGTGFYINPTPPEAATNELKNV